MSTERPSDASVGNIATPLHEAISRATERHPSISDAPSSMRRSRHATVSATAAALADAADADSADHDAAATLAPQMVDEAAIALGVHADRTVPVELDAAVTSRHHALAERLRDVPVAVRAGYADASAIARSEKAIGRAMRIRAIDIEHDADAEAHMVSMIVGAMMRTCLQRGLTVGALDDDGLMTLAQDACDASIGADA